MDLILDKGLVIDAYVRVSLAGIELLTVDARIVVASVDTYLRFAEAVNRLDLGQTEAQGLPALFGDSSGASNGNGSRSSRRGNEEGGRRGGNPAVLGAGTRQHGDDHSAEGGKGGGLVDRITERARR